MSTGFVTQGTRQLKNFHPMPAPIPEVKNDDESKTRQVEGQAPQGFEGSTLDRLIQEGAGAGVNGTAEAEHFDVDSGTDSVAQSEDMVTGVPEAAPSEGPATPTDSGVSQEEITSRSDSEEMNEEGMNMSAGTVTGEQQFIASEQDNACFTVLNMETDMIAPFAREYTEHLDVTNCVAEIPMLLDYMVRLERSFGVTLPFVACGVDTIVFDQSCTQQPNGPATIQVGVQQGDEEMQAFYEKILVDGVVYLSCINQSLNQDYLHQVITEAADAIYMNRSYTYMLVGPRPLNGRTVELEIESDEEAGDGEDAVPELVKRQEFIETLKLNSYEMSVFIGYMQSIPGVEIQHGTYDGRQAILFRRVGSDG